jgi:uncharacterized protein (TIGR00251 family)
LIDEKTDGVVLTLNVIPRAGKTTLAGTRGGAILVRLAAAPVDGAANEELVAFLADILDIPKARISLIAGFHSRAKRVKVSGITAASVRIRLGLP